MTPEQLAENERIRKEVNSKLDELFKELATNPSDTYTQDYFITAICLYMFDKSYSFGISYNDLTSLINLVLRATQAKQIAAKIKEDGGMENFLKKTLKEAGLDKMLEGLKESLNEPAKEAPALTMSTPLTISKKPGEADIIKFPGPIFEDRSDDDEDGEEG